MKRCIHALLLCGSIHGVMCANEVPAHDVQEPVAVSEQAEALECNCDASDTQSDVSKQQCADECGADMQDEQEDCVANQEQEVAVKSEESDVFDDELANMQEEMIEWGAADEDAPTITSAPQWQLVLLKCGDYVLSTGAACKRLASALYAKCAELLSRCSCDKTDQESQVKKCKGEHA